MCFVRVHFFTNFSNVWNQRNEDEKKTEIHRISPLTEKDSHLPQVKMLAPCLTLYCDGVRPGDKPGGGRYQKVFFGEALIFDHAFSHSLLFRSLHSVGPPALVAPGVECLS
jgi:hypothetical protein